jgi:hypothetical protein
VVARLVVNAPPVVTDDLFNRQTNAPFRVRISTLLANDSDPDSDAISLQSVAATSANGVPISIQGAFVVYTPSGGAETNDSFTYIIRDAFGATGTGTVTLNINGQATGVNLQTVELLPNGWKLIKGFGVIGRGYVIQAATDAAGPWTDLGEVYADPNGRFEFTDMDSVAASMRIYRAMNK